MSCITDLPVRIYDVRHYGQQQFWFMSGFQPLLQPPHKQSLRLVNLMEGRLACNSPYLPVLFLQVYSAALGKASFFDYIGETDYLRKVGDCVDKLSQFQQSYVTAMFINAGCSLSCTATSPFAECSCNMPIPFLCCCFYPFNLLNLLLSRSQMPVCLPKPIQPCWSTTALWHQSCCVASWDCQTMPCESKWTVTQLSTLYTSFATS